MATNREILKRYEARKAGSTERRSVPQTDPTELVIPPSPTSDGTAVPAALPAQQAPPAHWTVEEAPLPVFEPATPVEPTARAAKRRIRRDPRPLDMPPGDVLIDKHLRIYSHRNEQIRYEAFEQDLSEQQILETALAEYFSRRYAKRSNPSQGQGT